MMDSSANSSLDESGREFESLTEQECQLYLKRQYEKLEEKTDEQRIDSDVESSHDQAKVNVQIPITDFHSINSDDENRKEKESELVNQIH